MRLRPVHGHSPRAQQTMPVIGVLRSQPVGDVPHLLDAFREGLRESGHVDGHTVALEFRGADNDYGRLPTLAAELVARRVNVIVTTGAVSTVRAAMKATTVIPIVFVIGSDPVENKLVASLNRPGGNVTGATMIGGELLAKRFELLRELIPDLRSIGFLVNRDNPNTERELKELNNVAKSVNCVVHVAHARRETEIAMAFQSFVQAKAPAFLIGTDALFSGLPRHVAELARQHRMPAIYSRREYVAAGGLMSYGSNPASAYRVVGVYSGRILRGAKPADLPVMQPTKFDLAINLKAAQALGLTVSPTLLARADEVIE